ncbi:MAG: type II secretion system protein GspE [Acidobacteria bacterium]|nr:MAG: type II secretion system protein GspE [Acidobacteriota bacterium]
MKVDRIGDRLISAGLISSDQLDFALKEQKRTGDRLGNILRQLNLITEDDLAKVLAEAAGIQYVNVRTMSIDPNVVSLLPEAVARKYKVFPIAVENNSVTVAMADPLDVGTIDRVQQQTRRYVKVVSSTEFDILTTIDKYYGAIREVGNLEDLIEDAVKQTEAKGASEGREDLGLVAPVIKLIDLLILTGVSERATDIHFEPEKNLVRVRYRIDGVLKQGPYIPKKLERAINSRIKIMGNLNISESRLPQDGKATVSVYGKPIDIRVATFPTIHGENVVLRLLNKEQLVIGLESLGFSERNLSRFTQAISRPNGICLVTGPTGSGKTTTLYAALMRISTPERKIITLEDPVEYELPLIRQSQINVRAGLTYAAGLRAILRQDPDIILVGEMRDEETIDTAIRAALTGLLVFSTLHTNDAAATIPRLLDMGVEPFLAASSLVGVVAQRLVRLICKYCKQEVPPNPELALRLNVPDNKFYAGQGCKNCEATGYRGRTVISEIMLLSPRIQKAIMERADASLIREIAREEGMQTMLEDGVQKAINGVTTLEEVARVV